MKYIIIGNSAAGIGAVEGIRQIDKQSEIIIISDEKHHTYSRPLISYLLLGKVTDEKMKYRDDDFYEKNNAKLLAGVKAVNINSDKKSVVLSDGKNIEYDKLLVATGSQAFVPPFDGLDSVEKKYTFMSLDDAKNLEKAINKSSKVLIIGAGLIGLKCAEGIADKVSNITVVDLAPKILSSILDDGGAKIVQNNLESKGLNFKLSRSVKSFSGNTAILDNEEKSEFDVLVLAVGVRPNTFLLKDIAQIERGIIIDGKCQTSQADIYAAGDCTQSLDISSGQNKIMALLPNAYMQGECAGINMAGGEKEFNSAIPMNAIGFFGLHIVTAGNYVGDTYFESEGNRYKKLFYSDNKLNGYIIIDDKHANPAAFDKAGIYTSLIRERTSLDMLDFDLICKKPGLMAFTKEERSVKLSGAKKA
jgi:NAD(P)H-nitrite reductase large subunit